MKKILFGLVSLLEDLFTLVDHELALNICKVFTVAFIAGFMFSVACLDSDNWIRPAISTVVFMLGGTFTTLCIWILETEAEEVMEP